MIVGELAGILGLDAKPFEQGIDQAAEGGEGRMAKMGKAVTAIFAATGIAIGAALSKGFADYLDIDAGTDKLAAELGLTGEAAAAHGRAAANLYAGAWGDSMEEVQGAVAAVSSTLEDSMGDADDALERTAAKALDLAQAFEVDVARGVNSAGILVSSGLAKTADEAYDLMTRGMQKVPKALREDLLDATDEYAQFFAALGIGGGQAMGLLVNASADGMYGIDKLGDSLKELTIRSTDMSTASVDAYTAAGLNAEKMAARFLKGGDTARGALSDLVDGLLGIEDPVKRSNAAIGLFGTPLEDLNVAEIPDFLRSLRDMGDGLEGVEGAAERMGDTLNDNWKTKLEAWKRQGAMRLVNFIQGTAIPAVERLGEKFGPDLARLFIVGRDAARRVADVFGERGLAGVIDLAREKWDELSPAMRGVVAGIGVVVAALAGAGIVGVVSAVVGAVAALLSPVVLVVGGLAALVAGLVWAYSEFEAFRDVVDRVASFLAGAWDRAVAGARDAWPVILAVIAAVAGWLQADLLPILADGADRAGDIWGGTVRLVQRYWPAIQAAIGAVVGWLIREVVPLIADAARNIRDQFGDLVDWVKENWDNIETTITRVVQVIGTVLGVVLGGIILGAIAWWERFGQTVIDNVQNVWNIVAAIIEIGLSTIRTLIEVVTSIISGDWAGAWDALKEHWSLLWEQVGSILENAGQILLRILGAALSLLWDAVVAGVGFIVDQWAQMPGRILALLSGLGQLLWDLVTAALAWMLEGTIEAAGALLAWWLGLPGAVLRAVGDFGGTLWRNGTKWVGRLVDAAAEKGLELIAWATGLPGRIVDTIGDLGSTLLQTGKDLVQGLIDGIKEVAGDIADAILGPVSDAVDGAKGFLGISSPSRLMAQVGRWTVAGMAQGIDRERRLPAVAMGRVLADLTRAVDAEAHRAVLMGPGPGAVPWRPAESDRAADPRPSDRPVRFGDTYVDARGIQDPQEVADLTSRHVAWRLAAGVAR